MEVVKVSKKNNKKIAVLGLAIIIVFLIGALLGYIIGYMAGAQRIVAYAVEIIDEVRIGNLSIAVEINQTKIDKILDKIEEYTNELNKRVDNITISVP